MGPTTTGAQAAQQITDSEQQGWEQAASSAAPSAPPPPASSTPPPPAAAPSSASGTGANVTFPETTPPATAPVVTSQKRQGIMGVVDSMLDVLTGRTTPETGVDQYGNKYVKQTTLTHGQQWMRLAGTLAHGAAAGLAAGRGAGHMGDAALAGFNAQQSDADKQHARENEMNAQARQQNLDNANNQALRMQMAEQAWKFTRLQQTAAQENVAWAQGQVDRYVKEGGQVLATAEHAADIGKILKANPDVMRDMIVHHQIELVPHYNEDGTPGGIVAIKMPNGYRNQMLPTGTVFHTFDSATGKLVEHQASEPMTAAERDDYETAAGVAQLKFQNDQAELAFKQQQTAASKATASEAPSNIRKNNAEANSANAEAELRKQQTQQMKSGMLNPDGTPNPVYDALVSALYDGDIMPSDLKRETAGKGIDPNQVVAGAVRMGQQTGKPWSESIIKQEHRFAESPKTQAAIDGIDRIIGPNGYMQTMLNAADKAHLTSNGAFNSVALAIARTVGQTEATNFNTAVSETRRSIAGLIGNPLLGGGETDKKLEQAEDMLGGHPTMDNLRGAAALLTNALQTQRNSIVNSNRFLVKRYGSSGQPQQSNVQPPPDPPPAPPNMKNIWAPGSPTWKQVPANAVPQGIPGLVVK